MLPGAVLALDVGTRTIGVAHTDPSRRFVFADPTLARRSVRADAASLATICSRHAVVQLVVGVPLPTEGEITSARGERLARQVGDALAALTGLAVAYVDESFTTLEAHARLREAGADERRRRGVIDGHAAVVILEDWLALTGGDAPPPQR